MSAFQCVGRTIDATLSVAGNGITEYLSIALQAALLKGQPAVHLGLFSCLRGAISEPFSAIEASDVGANLVGSTFNIQNFIPHKSQKTKVAGEANRAKEFQRGTAGVPQSVKEGARGLAEGSDIGLGPGFREFESRHSDHKSRKSVCSLGFYLLNARLE